MQHKRSPVRRILSKYYGKLKARYFRYKIDYNIVSFPKSGRTWLRVFLAKYSSLKFDVPLSLDFLHWKKRKSEPRIRFTHTDVMNGRAEDITQSSKYFKDKNVLFLARHPCDVVVSYYYQVKNRSGWTPLMEESISKDISLKEFIRNPRFGLERIIFYMNLYISQKDEYKSFLLVRYEDLKEDNDEFKKVINFIGLGPVENEIFKKASEYSDFSNMKKMEKENRLKDWRLQTFDKNNPNAAKVRKGKVGGYRDEFDEEDIRYAKKVLKKLDKAFHYEI